MLSDTLALLQRYPLRPRHLDDRRQRFGTRRRHRAIPRRARATTAFGSPITEAPPAQQTTVYGWIGLLEAVICRYLGGDTGLTREETIRLIARAINLFADSETHGVGAPR